MLPIVDASGLMDGDRRALERVAREIGGACRERGFFYVTNTGVTHGEMDAMLAAARRFFAMPEAEKTKLAITAQSANRGYVGMRTEALDPGRNIDVKEAFNIGLELADDDPEIAADVMSRGRNHWPDDLPGFREDCLSAFDRMWRLGRDLHRAIAVDLDLPPDHFEPHFERPMATLRMLHYPPAILKDGEFGAGAHTDYGNLTILLTDEVGGLQVQALDGGWIDAPPIPGAFVCNIGDCLMRWTNDVYASTPHRVRSSQTRHRYSVAFFLDPAPDALVEAVPGCVAADRPARHAPITAAAYFAERFAATYGFGKPKG